MLPPTLSRYLPLGVLPSAGRHVPNIASIAVEKSFVFIVFLLTVVYFTSVFTWYFHEKQNRDLFTRLAEVALRTKHSKIELPVSRIRIP